ncbi:MAG TPA: acetamidase/formamidase family protein [Burkholderiales bacterium]|nr:acetamidase/formamidase family protein [Burkholderiales bacterium]
MNENLSGSGLMRWLAGGVLAASTLAGAGAAAADTIYLPITRVNEWPVPCAEEKLGTCHNRWHPDIKPAATANPGDTVIFETRDALDGPFKWDSGPKTVAAANLNLVHPLTGPLFVNGAERGDVLAVTVLDVIPAPDRFGYTIIVPGFGFLRDAFPNPYIVHWKLMQRPTGVYYAISDDLPGVELPLHGFTGTIGVALGMPEIENAYQREEELRKAGGFVLPPEPHDALPADLCGPGGRAAARCLRTIPPRENGGNTDVKQMVRGTTLLFPCWVKGCLLSMGDTHFAQGDGEVSGTAIEMNAVVTVKVEVRKGQAAYIRWPQIEGKAVAGILKDLEPERFVATMGIPVKPKGEMAAPIKYLDGTRFGQLTNMSEDTTLAARDALLKMIDLLTGPQSPSKHKLSREQAYILCSVACDLKISNMVDVPNYVVTDVLHLDVFK